MKANITHNGHTFTFSDEDIANLDDFEPTDDRSIYCKQRGFLFHDHGFTVCVVFADNLQDAMDIAVDEGKFNRYLIPTAVSCDDDNAQSNLELMDYLTPNIDEIAAGYDVDCPECVIDGVRYWWKYEPAHLGNAGEPHDIDTLGYVEFPCPPMSVTRLIGDGIEATAARYA